MSSLGLFWNLVEMVNPVFKYLRPYTPPLAAGDRVDVALRSDEVSPELDCDFYTIVHGGWPPAGGS